MTTFSIKAKDIKNDWYVVNAENKTLGRLATFLASRLRGKHKPEFTPHLDTGDYIIVTNVEKIKVTGNKADDKIYHHHTGFQGGLKSIAFNKLLIKDPTRILHLAVKGMLPKGVLGREMLQKLKIYAGTDHPHTAQQPQPLTVEE